MEAMRNDSLHASDRVERHESRVDRTTAEYIEGQHRAKDEARCARDARGDSAVPNQALQPSEFPVLGRDARAAEHDVHARQPDRPDSGGGEIDVAKGSPCSGQAETPGEGHNDGDFQNPDYEPTDIVEDEPPPDDIDRGFVGSLEPEHGDFISEMILQ